MKGFIKVLAKLVRVNKTRICFLALSMFFLPCAIASSSPTFVSLKSANINMRVGPGDEYPTSWALTRANLPVMLVAEFKDWKKIKLADQTEGWVHKNMVSRKNTAIVTAEYAILYRNRSGSHPMAKMEKNVIVKILKTDKDFVKIEVNKIKGWVEKKDLWGVNEDSI